MSSRSNSLIRVNTSTLIDSEPRISLISELIEAKNGSCPNQSTLSVTVTRMHRPTVSLIKLRKDTESNYDFHRYLGRKRNDPRVSIWKMRKHHVKPSQVAHHEILEKDAQSDESDVTVNQQVNLTKIDNKISILQCIGSVGLIVLVMAIIVTLVVTILFTVPQSNTRSTPNANEVSLRWNRTAITVAGVTNRSGNASNLLNEPWDLVVDWSNTMYVTDKINNRVQKFLMGSSNGVTVAGQASGIGGIGLSYLSRPFGIAVDDNSNVYVTDNGNSRIVLWSHSTSVGYHVAGNGTGNSLDQLSDPYGLARDSTTGEIYVADFANHRIVRYSTNNSTGTLMAGGHGQGTNDTQLSSPSTMYFDAVSNSLLIVNTGAHRILRWKIGEKNWTHLLGHTNNTPGSTLTSLRSPTDVMLDPMGNMYVADRNNHRILFFQVGESNGTIIAGSTGVTGMNSTLFYSPSSIALDNQLNLYVTDRFNHRIQKFVRY